MDSLAAVDWAAYEQQALSAISGDALEDARVKYLGRKSELAQALRGVRDKESGMLLNGVKARLEAAVTAREHELELAARDRAQRFLFVRGPVHRGETIQVSSFACVGVSDEAPVRGRNALGSVPGCAPGPAKQLRACGVHR